MVSSLLWINQILFSKYTSVHSNVFQMRWQIVVDCGHMIWNAEMRTGNYEAETLNNSSSLLIKYVVVCDSKTAPKWPLAL